MAAGEKDKMVQQICDISSDSSSEYDCGGEISSQSSMACVTSTTSTTETAQNKTASKRSLLSVCKGQHLQICVGKEMSDKIHQKERNARFQRRPVALIPLPLKDVQSFQVSFLEFQLENCFVIAVEKSYHLSEVLSRTMWHH